MIDKLTKGKEMRPEKSIGDRIRELDDLILTLKKSIAQSSEGSLQIWRSGKRTQYYHHIKENEGGAIRYISKNDRVLIQSLAQKDYEKKVLQAAEAERSYLLKIRKGYPDKLPEEIYQGLDPIRQEEVRSVFQSEEDFVREWQKRNYISKPFREGDPEYYTDRGERVRSKSEVIIANKLSSAGVPYLYECPIVLRNGTLLYPDFTVLNVRERKTMIWEHLGMMDDESYCQRALERILVLEREGYFPGKNLILTHETSRRPLDTRLLESVMQCYLL